MGSKQFASVHPWKAWIGLLVWGGSPNFGAWQTVAALGWRSGSEFTPWPITGLGQQHVGHVERLSEFAVERSTLNSAAGAEIWSACPPSQQQQQQQQQHFDVQSGCVTSLTIGQHMFQKAKELSSEFVEMLRA